MKKNMQKQKLISDGLSEQQKNQQMFTANDLDRFAAYFSLLITIDRRIKVTRTSREVADVNKKVNDSEMPRAVIE